jgi:uncharacterized protein
MFAERPTVQWLTGKRLHLQHGPIDVVLKAWAAAQKPLPPWGVSGLRDRARGASTDAGRSLSHGERVGVRGSRLSIVQNPSPGASRHPLPMGEGDRRRRTRQFGRDFPWEREQPADLTRAYAAAAERFQTILGELVAELGALRKPMHNAPQVTSPAARRMVAACAPFVGMFITPMAAVAGAVADELLAAMLVAAPLAKAYVNDGGDIAIHIAPGESLDIGMAGNGTIPAMNGRITLAAGNGIGGIATSGHGGRSLSMGIADSVTVLARNAAIADAAATLIANAVNIDSPAIRRAPAVSFDPDSDLGERLVTVDVGPLTDREIAAALASGQDRAAEFRRAGSIAACALTLQGKTLIVGDGLAAAPPASRRIAQ